MSGGIYVPPMSLNLGDTVAPLRASPLDEDRLAYPGNLPLVRGGAPSALHSIEQLALTPRQREVLQLLLHGKSNKMIARDLGISVETVKDHVAAVLRSLNVNSRTQAVLAVSQMGQQPRTGLQLSPPSLVRATRF
jgi:DNA-binding NarL/FixJ family response regulator